MEKLSKDGVYTVEPVILEKIKSEFSAYCCDEENCMETIKSTFGKYSYLCDPHTAVAVKAAHLYLEENGTGLKNIVASTASPYKFAADVLVSLGESVPENLKDVLVKLSEISKTEIPSPLETLFDKSVRFTKSVEKSHESLLCEVLSF